MGPTGMPNLIMAPSIFSMEIPVPSNPRVPSNRERSRALTTNPGLSRHTMGRFPDCSGKIQKLSIVSRLVVSRPDDLDKLHHPHGREEVGPAEPFGTGHEPGHLANHNDDVLLAIRQLSRTVCTVP